MEMMQNFVKKHSKSKTHVNEETKTEASSSRSEVDSPLDKQYENRIRPFIDVIDSLRELGIEEELALPAIVVIGDQSSGKSSVLEALSGVCLPKGNGIVTRCPLELRLKKGRRDMDWRATISYFDEKETLSNPLQVKDRIMKAQKTITRSDEGISDEIITLEIVSSNVPDLTLIDLPGITRVALQNQPENIEEQIKAMIRKYIERKETIILVIIPSILDVATAEALKMAKEVDPNGDRTIGILTKPDLVDKGSEEKVLSTVKNEICNLKKGFMIVKCGTQEDLKKNLSLQDVLRNERKFFNKHKHFRVFLENRQATLPILAEKLTTELVTHIARTLPELKKQIKMKLHQAEDELKMIVLPDEEEDIYFLVKIITKFTSAITYMVNGELDGESEDLNLFKQLRKDFGSWEKLMEESSSQFVNKVKEERDIDEDKFRGRELPGFFNYKKVENILNKQIQSFQEPALGILHKVNLLVEHCFRNKALKHFEEFTNLRDSALDKILDISREQDEKAEKTIKLQFQMEGIIYCQDSIYCQALRAERPEEASEGPMPPRLQGYLSIEILASHLQAYLFETTTRLSNQIPLIIQHYILKEYAEKLCNQMILLIHKKEMNLLENTNELSTQKQLLKSHIDCLKKAEESITSMLKPVE